MLKKCRMGKEIWLMGKISLRAKNLAYGKKFGARANKFGLWEKMAYGLA